MVYVNLQPDCQKEHHNIFQCISYISCHMKNVLVTYYIDTILRNLLAWSDLGFTERFHKHFVAITFYKWLNLCVWKSVGLKEFHNNIDTVCCKSTACITFAVQRLLSNQ